MAAYFQLISKQTGEATPFNKIDEELCDNFEQPVDEHKYLSGWYDSIGLRLALGKSFDEIIAEFKELKLEALTLIAEYLQEHYNANNWSGR